MKNATLVYLGIMVVGILLLLRWLKTVKPSGPTARQKQMDDLIMRRY